MTVSGHKAVRGKRRQRGVVLLAVLTLLTLWGLSLFVGQLTTKRFQMAAEQNDVAALAEAKAALIGRAATDSQRPGSLACPAVDDDGVSPLFIGNHCPSYIGRLPWKTLRLADLRDHSGERLWYALAPALRDDDSAQPINLQKPLELTLDGVANIAAIIFSAGPALASQGSRPSNNVADYLDGSNSDGDYRFVTGPTSQTFNDKALAITRDDLFGTVGQRVLAEVRGQQADAPGAAHWGLRDYHAQHATFPWADSGIDGYGDVGTTAGNLPYRDLAMPAPLPTWLSLNGWLPLVSYQRLSPGLARIGIVGSTRTKDVIPCAASPCP